MKRNINDMAKKAVETGDARLAGAVADALRFRRGMRYREIWEYVNKLTGVSQNKWETLMYEADTE